MSLPEGICERVVIGSQARLRIWCLRAYGFESLRSHIFWRLGSTPRSLFFAPAGGVLETLRASRSRTPLSLRDISRERMETSVAVSVARTLSRGRGVFPGLFFCACGRSSGKRSGPRGFVPLCHCVTSPEGELKRLPPFRSLARFLEVEEYSPVSFFAPAGGVLENAPSKSYESAVGGAAVGGMAAHGLVNGMSGASPTGMSEANLPRPHLRRARYRP